MKDENGFKIKRTRCEWQIVENEVDQYNKITVTRGILACYPTYKEAYVNLPNHGYTKPLSGGYVRWIPNNPIHGYVQLDIIYREVDITET